MAERLMGMETEYAFTALAPDGTSAGRNGLLERLVELARESMPSLPDHGRLSIFLQNGSRFYIDTGGHPEMSTPECPSPWEVVRYVKAGDSILAGLAGKLEAETPGLARVVVSRGNIDHSGTGSTWGCHESYLHRVRPEPLAEQLIPHLVSRIVFTGAGGFDPLSPGLAFTLSPRVAHLTRVVSPSSTNERGIFHTKEDPLCGNGYSRLHVLCGDSLCSETGLGLLAGTTALVVALVEAGDRPGDAVRLASPLDAMRAFAADPLCEASAALEGGRSATALAIQRHYLSAAETRLGGGSLPAWAGEVCGEWRRVLDRLEADPRGLSTTLDWAVKLALYRDHARGRGVEWDSLSVWTHVLRELLGALAEAQRPGEPVTLAWILDEGSPVKGKITELTAFLGGKNLGWDGLPGFLALGYELLETETRFAELGERGIFAGLDRAGVLTHRLAAVGDVAGAVERPPSSGRARLRGEWIRKLAQAGGSYRCTWQAISDRGARRVLDLSDPFETGERWIAQPEPEPDPDPFHSLFARRRPDLFSLLMREGL